MRAQFSMSRHPRVVAAFVALFVVLILVLTMVPSADPAAAEGATPGTTEPAAETAEPDPTTPPQPDPLTPAEPDPTTPPQPDPVESTPEPAVEAPLVIPAPRVGIAPLALATGERLSCESGTFYSVSSTGAVRQVVGSTVSVAGTWPGTWASMNALAIGAGGDVAFALERSGRSANDVTAFVRYTPEAGWKTVRTADYSTGNSGALVAGAVNLTNGLYYFGGFHDGGANLHFRLHKFDPATGIASFVGSFDTGLDDGTTANGDMAFDAAGNLYIVQSGSDANIFSVTAATLAAANGGTLARSATNSLAVGMSAVNGIAFDDDGSVFLGTATQVRRYDASTWTQIGAAITNSLVSSTDLASCVSPANLTIRKDVVGRVADADQFRLIARSGSTVVAEATTVGTATGIQSEQIGPVPVIAGSTYAFSEAMASGNAADYASSYICTDETGATLTTGSSASGSVTVPRRGGASVVCTFRNAPLITPVVIHKIVEDTAGDNPQPGVGWALTAAVAQQSGSVTIPTPATKHTGTDGSATWSIRYGTTQSRASIAISETQQPGFEFDRGTCTVTPLVGATTTIDLSASGGTLTGVAPGSAVDCTIVNRQLATMLTLVKEIGLGDAAPTAWQLSAVGPQGSMAGPAGVTGTPDATSEITPNVAYQLGETGTDARYVQDGAWACVNQLEQPLAVTEQGAVTVANAGDQVTCTVTNTTAELTLLKFVQDENGELVPADFDLTAVPAAFDGLTATTVEGAEAVGTANTFFVRPDHAYAIAEAGESAHLALTIERYVGPADGEIDHHDAGQWEAVTDASVVTTGPGEHAVYRFVNASAPAFALPLTGGIGTDQVVIGGAATLTLAVLAGLWFAARRRRAALAISSTL